MELCECPLCYARGTLKGSPFKRGTPTELCCPLCEGSGSVVRSTVADLQRLREEMQRVADLMQAGDADGAAVRVRIAVRLVRALAPHV